MILLYLQIAQNFFIYNPKTPKPRSLIIISKMKFLQEYHLEDVLPLVGQNTVQNESFIEFIVQFIAVFTVLLGGMLLQWRFFEGFGLVWF